MDSATKLISAFDDKRAAELFREILATAGITVGGDAPWDMQVHDDRLYARVLREGTLGFGEAYVEGWWDSPSIDELSTRLLHAKIDEAVRENWVLLAHVVRARLFNLQAITRAFEIGQRHYDLGNELYEAMLDRRMIYTCAYWNGAQTLDEAQEAKLELVCQKIGARPGMRILDLGCGWAGFASYVAERHGAQVVGMTVSKEQVAWAKAKYPDLPIDIRLDDYRNATGTYDAVVSIGLLEHVGPKNYRGYMELVDRCLVPDGVAFIHTITGNHARRHIDPWYNKYIFPNAVLPTVGQITGAMEQLFVVEDIHNIGPHYDRTLMEWNNNFEAAWPKLRATHDEKFYRMWRFYLHTSAASFRARYLGLHQTVMTRIGTTQPDCRKS
jgi:cyclopropane-fatty-acyl-phospholipid synthase